MDDIWTVILGNIRDDRDFRSLLCTDKFLSELCTLHSKNNQYSFEHTNNTNNTNNTFYCKYLLTNYHVTMIEILKHKELQELQEHRTNDRCMMYFPDYDNIIIITIVYATESIKNGKYVIMCNLSTPVIKLLKSTALSILDDFHYEVFSTVFCKDDISHVPSADIISIAIGITYGTFSLQFVVADREYQHMIHPSFIKEQITPVQYSCVKNESVGKTLYIDDLWQEKNDCEKVLQDNSADTEDSSKILTKKLLYKYDTIIIRASYPTDLLDRLYSLLTQMNGVRRLIAEGSKYFYVPIPLKHVLKFLKNVNREIEDDSYKQDVARAYLRKSSSFKNLNYAELLVAQCITRYDWVTLEELYKICTNISGRSPPYTHHRDGINFGIRRTDNSKGNGLMLLDPNSKITDIPTFTKAPTYSSSNVTNVIKVPENLIDGVKAKLKRTLETPRVTYDSYSVNDLKLMCEKYGLKKSGTRHDVAQRLLDNI